MIYLIVDDEHELYRCMFSDLFKTDEFEIHEVPRTVVPKPLKPLYKLHYNNRINSHIFLPFKMLWKPCYRLHKYNFDDSREYTILFMNGSLRFHYSESYLKELKRKHPNIRLAMILYDSFINPAAQRSIKMIPVFDYVFSFDKGDCEAHNLEYIYSTFSCPDFVKHDESKHTSAFFIGFGQGRLELLQNTFSKISDKVSGCKFYIAGVKEQEQKPVKDVYYNRTMPYSEELEMAYNTDCIVEVVKEGQTGVSLRTCEAIAFNKKLLTNNIRIKEMPFYDERFISVFEKPEDIDIEFIRKKVKAEYKDNTFFSPVNILRRIETLNQK